MKLSPEIDLASHRAQFQREGKVQIAPFLADDVAHRMRAHLLGRGDWVEVLNSGDRTFEIDRAGQSALSEPERTQLNELVNASARDGFQYRYETLRVPNSTAERKASAGEMLADFAEFMSNPPALSLLRDITGCNDIAFADAQATLYRPGDFLTAHDDAVEGKSRLAAYVLGLTPDWRTEWGGLLMFHDKRGDVSCALLPRFNSLTLFSVPQLHSVSLVAPFTGGDRLSITGWLRASRPA